MKKEKFQVSDKKWTLLAEFAWGCRKNAKFENTRVGAAVLTSEGKIFVGCNIEHQFRSHDIHAEVNAIGSMVAAGYKNMKAILIVAKRDFFTPCGACMDWIIQFGGLDCEVGFQADLEGEIKKFKAKELMPFYPR